MPSAVHVVAHRVVFPGGNYRRLRDQLDRPGGRLVPHAVGRGGADRRICLR